MSGKTKVILKSKDGRTFSKEFDSYEEATQWVSDNATRAGINISLEAAFFDQEPTIEIYKEAP